MQKYNNPYPIEKIISAGTYLSAGIVGCVWLIIATISKRTVKPFVMYHIFQSIFLYILYVLLRFFIGLLLVILLKIPFIGYLVGVITYYMITPLPFMFNLSIIQTFTTLIIVYLATTSFMGYYSYIPWVSDIIKGNTRQ